MHAGLGWAALGWAGRWAGHKQQRDHGTTPTMLP